MEFNSSELENGGNQESMKIRNPFQNFPPFFVGGKKGVTLLKQVLIDRAKKRDDPPDTHKICICICITDMYMCKIYT